MNEEKLRYINKIIIQKKENEKIKNSTEYKEILHKINEINNNINSYSEDEQQYVRDYQQSLLMELNKFDKQYAQKKKLIENQINNMRQDYENENKSITEHIKKLKSYEENVKKNIYNLQIEIKNELGKDVSKQDFDLIQEKNQNIKLYQETITKINGKLLENVNKRAENEKILKNLSYENISIFSKEIEEFNKKRKSVTEENIQQDMTESNEEKKEERQEDNKKDEKNAEPNVINISNEPTVQQDDDKKSFQYEENKKLKIFVNDKGYCIDGAIEPKEINYKLLNKDEKTELEKCFLGEDYNEIMENMKNKKVQKSYDPNLLKILYNSLGKDSAIKYLQELSKGRKANKGALPYEITYDIRSLKRNKSLKTKRQLKDMVKIVRRNKYVANIIDRNRRRLKYGVVGLLAAGIGVISNVQGITNSNGNKPQELLGPTKEYTDSITPEKNEEQIHDEEKTKFAESIKVESADNIDLAQKQIDDLLNKLEEFNLGNKVNLEEGVNYTEDSLGGGNSGTVGKIQWRPAGDYIVNGVSVINPSTNEIVTYSFGNDENGNKNPNFSLNKYLRENVKKGMEVKFHIDKDGTKPTGWIDSSKIVNSIEKEENQNEQINIDNNLQK